MTATVLESPKPIAPERDSAGVHCTSLGPVDVKALEHLLGESGFEPGSLRGRHSVVFVFPGIGVGQMYPELAGCTAEVCTFAGKMMEFARHGIQLIGLSTRPAQPDGDLIGILPFPVGEIPENAESELIEFVERDGRKYALRETFLVFPDSTGVRIRGIQDTAAHVRKCFDAVVAKRLETYRSAILTGLERETRAVRSTLELRDFLPNGAGSISIARIELRSELVCKMADPEIIAEEAG